MRLTLKVRINSVLGLVARRLVAISIGKRETVTPLVQADLSVDYHII